MIPGALACECCDCGTSICSYCTCTTPEVYRANYSGGTYCTGCGGDAFSSYKWRNHNLPTTADMSRLDSCSWVAYSGAATVDNYGVAGCVGAISSTIDCVFEHFLYLSQTGVNQWTFNFLLSLVRADDNTWFVQGVGENWVDYTPTKPICNAAPSMDLDRVPQLCSDVLSPAVDNSDLAVSFIADP